MSFKESEFIASPKEAVQRLTLSLIPTVNRATEEALGEVLTVVDYSPLTADKIFFLSDEEAREMADFEYESCCAAYFLGKDKNGYKKGIYFNWEAVLREMDDFSELPRMEAFSLRTWLLFRDLTHENIHRLCRSQALDEEEEDVVREFCHNFTSVFLESDLSPEEKRGHLALSRLLEEERLEIDQWGLEFIFEVDGERRHRVGSFVNESLVIYLTGVIMGEHGKERGLSDTRVGLMLNYHLSGDIPEGYVNSISGIRDFLQRQGFEEALSAYLNGQFYQRFVHHFNTEQRWEIFIFMTIEDFIENFWETVNKV